MIRVERSVWLGVVGALLLTTACGETQETAPAARDKAAFNLAIDELTDLIGVVAAFEPYLQEPENKPYSPQRRPDLLKSQFYAATTIRHAANYARQRGERSKSAVTKGLADALAALAKACSEPADGKDVVKCAQAVRTFDDALQKVADEAKSSGADKPFPRVTKEFVSANASKELAPFHKAMGPAEKEKEYLAKRSDEKASIDDMMSICDSAKAEVEATEQAMQNSEEAIRELAVVHKYAVETQCNRFGSVLKAHQELSACEKTKDTPECKSACGKVQRAVEQGMPAAAFKKVESDYKATCEEKK